MATTGVLVLFFLAVLIRVLYTTRNKLVIKCSTLFLIHNLAGFVFALDMLHTRPIILKVISLLVGEILDNVAIWVLAFSYWKASFQILSSVRADGQELKEFTWVNLTFLTLNVAVPALFYAKEMATYYISYRHGHKPTYLE